MYIVRHITSYIVYSAYNQQNIDTFFRKSSVRHDQAKPKSTTGGAPSWTIGVIHTRLPMTRLILKVPSAALSHCDLRSAFCVRSLIQSVSSFGEEPKFCIGRT